MSRVDGRRPVEAFAYQLNTSSIVKTTLIVLHHEMELEAVDKGYYMYLFSSTTLKRVLTKRSELKDSYLI